MNKKFYMVGLLLSALTLSTSCGSDDDDNNGGGGTPITPTSVPTTAGALSSGTDADKALPEGYRLTSAGYYTFGYDENGKLTSFDGDQVKDGVISGGHDGYKWTDKLSISKDGLLIALTSNEEEKNEYDSYAVATTATFSYNASRQLVGMSTTYTTTETEDGYKYVEKGTISATFKYDGGKLVSINSKGNGTATDGIESEKYSEDATWTLSYDETYPNIFFQYTPNMAEAVSDATWEMTMADGYALLGLLGRASNVLPTTIAYVEKSVEDGEADEDTHNIQCGPYSYNEYGAIASADRQQYSYGVTTRAAVPEWQAVAKRPSVRERIAKLRSRMHNSK